MKNKCELCEDEAMSKESRFCYDCALKYKKGLDEGYDLGCAQCLKDNNLDEPKKKGCGKMDTTESYDFICGEMGALCLECKSLVGDGK